LSIHKNIFIITTVPSKQEGETIASKLVENNNAACVNIIPNVTSIYKWNNKINKDDELLLLIKTSTENEAQVYDIIRDKHSYGVPEIITIEINNIDKKYGEWLNSCVNPKSKVE